MSRTTEWTIYCDSCDMNISSFESEADLFAKAERDGWQLGHDGITDQCQNCKKEPKPYRP